ncbi:MAG: TIR domain-containing protein [Brevinematales bacterium]|jgi:hypothetical protein
MPKRQVFYSFHYEADNWRVSQIRNIGTIEDNKTVSDNDWETIKKGGDSAIENWINRQLYGRTCTIVLVGSATYGRKWINYEIKKSWNEKKGLLGIYIHHLKNNDGEQATMGLNPFSYFQMPDYRLLSSVVNCYSPPFTDSKKVYEYISDNLEDWVEDAIDIRSNYLTWENI